MNARRFLFALPLTLAALAPALAQEAASPDETAPAEAAAVEAAPSEPAPVAVAAEPETATMSEDEMANYLNSQPRITQGVTLTLTVDGEVVETAKKTITYARNDPVLATESGTTAMEQLKAEFDTAAMTRKEAYEEARLDFVVADLDRDGRMTADEFAFLVKGWSDATVAGGGRSRFVDLESHAADADHDALHDEQARKKFGFMAGGGAEISRKDYVREVLIEFDALDLNDDGLLKDEELLHFRAANRGEPLDHDVKLMEESALEPVN